MSPIVLLSGCVGFGEEYTRVEGFSNRDVGAVVLKGTTGAARLGNPPHRVCETAIQCLGGYGYCAEYPLEQYLRDVKIMSLYEGTNGIQSMDLMGRKLQVKNGACFTAFREEIEGFCSAHRMDAEIGDRVRALEGVAGRLWAAAGEMAGDISGAAW